MKRRDAHMDETPPLIPDIFYEFMLAAAVMWQLVALTLFFFKL